MPHVSCERSYPQSRAGGCNGVHPAQPLLWKMHAHTLDHNPHAYVEVLATFSGHLGFAALCMHPGYASGCALRAHVSCTRILLVDLLDGTSGSMPVWFLGKIMWEKTLKSGLAFHPSSIPFCFVRSAHCMLLQSEDMDVCLTMRSIPPRPQMPIIRALARSVAKILQHAPPWSAQDF